MRRTDPISADGYFRVLAKTCRQGNRSRAEQHEAGDHDPCVLRVHGRQRADVFLPEAVFILDKPADEPGDRERDRTGQSKSTEPHVTTCPHA
jgi:hypothetical protein